MDNAGVRHTTELYEGVQHGYTMSDMGAYNEAAAERHFKALLALLQRQSRGENIAGATRAWRRCAWAAGPPDAWPRSGRAVGALHTCGRRPGH